MDMHEVHLQGRHKYLSGAQFCSTNGNVIGRLCFSCPKTIKLLPLLRRHSHSLQQNAAWQICCCSSSASNRNGRRSSWQKGSTSQMKHNRWTRKGLKLVECRRKTKGWRSGMAPRGGRVAKAKRKRREKGRRVARDGECKGRCLATLPCNDT